MIKYKITKKDFLEKLDDYINHHFKILDNKLKEGASSNYEFRHQIYAKNMNRLFKFFYDTEKPDWKSTLSWYKEHGYRFDEECLNAKIKTLSVAGFVSDYKKMLENFKDTDAIELWLEHGTDEFNCIAFDKKDD